jgi:hypothetical protein
VSVVDSIIGSWSIEMSHQKFPCGIAAEYGGLFAEDPAATI